MRILFSHRIQSGDGQCVRVQELVAALRDLGHEVPVAGFGIALHPLVVSYASRLTIFEYIAAGRAIVALNQPNIREVLCDGETAVCSTRRRPGRCGEPSGDWLATRRCGFAWARRRGP